VRLLVAVLGAAVLHAQDLTQIEAWRASVAARNTKALILVHRGKTLVEWYAPDFGADRKHGTASLAKALVGGTSLLLATNDRLVSPDDLAAKFIPSWKSDPRKTKITIRHLATHSSGIQDANIDGVPHDKLPGWMGAFWRREPDPFSISLRDAPVIFEPGKGYQYSNPGMAMLAYAVTASLRGGDIRTLLKSRVMDPLGIPESEWSIGYGRAYEVDGLRLWANWGGGAFTARAAARLGQWMMRRGEGKVSADLARHAVRPAGTPLPDRVKEPFAPASGLAWYSNDDGVWPSVPRDAFAGAGAQHQVLLVVPSLDLVMVRNGGVLDPNEKAFWTPVYHELFEPLLRAFTEHARLPYPPSPVIRRVNFAPESEIVRKAPGSDNWPMTWADDNHLYTVYGDGWGFEPLLKTKLSQGFARIEGDPGDFRAFNIRSETGERRGEGKNGPKASGLLMVDGVLYMFVRNTGNATLAWSRDRGRTWEWGFRFDESFASPAFLNFGRNYSGALDEYIYLYSQDGQSAYEHDDSVVLARAPKLKLKDRSAWEFFQQVDSRGRPVWTREIAHRGPAFRYPGHCERVDAVYNPGLKRYLLTVGYGHHGGWGLYDAPAPWGPWTTAFHQEAGWLPETHGYRLPAKWISSDGTTLWLVYSGRGKDDAFCLRGMKLELNARKR
jgi:CubicO group peptidase (beta-lactamase class C family)